jgi:hypothetical protein
VHPLANGQRRWPPAARNAAAIIATAGLALLVVACDGGSSGSHVAELGSTTTQPASSSGASNAGGSTNSRSPTSQALAFARCMRSNHVSNFPDPNSSGVFPKPAIYQLAASNPRFQAAIRVCAHLLPNGGPGVAPSRTVVQQIQNDMVKFAGCMHSHGVATWPAPTLDRGRAIFNPQAVGIDPNSPQIGTTVHECERVFPARIGIPPGA